MKTNPTIETASALLIADYLRELYLKITQLMNILYYGMIYCLKYYPKGIYDVIMKRFNNFDWESAENGYKSYKAECEDFILNFIDFAASENEDLLPSFDDYIKRHI